MRVRQGLVAFAIGDIRDADSNMLLLAGWHAAEANFARELLTCRILVRPFEYRMFARQRTLDVSTPNTERRRTVRLHLRADGLRPNGDQSRTRKVEQRTRLVIHIDEPIVIDVENDNRFRRILDQRAVTLLVFS